MRAITASELRDLVPMRDAVELMKAVFRQYTDGETISPLRTPISMPDGSGVSLFMPAYIPASESAPAASGAKVVSVYSGNLDAGLPTINSVVLLLDPTTGVPAGLIEGAAMTALRTGAVSGAATDLMARLESAKLLVFGAGAQGVTQAAAVAAIRDLDMIAVYDPNEQMAQSFAERLARWDADASRLVSAIASPKDVMQDVDIVCTATTSSTPVFEDTWVRPGTHISAVGSFQPTMQEIPVETIKRARVAVDAIEAVLEETGDFIIPIERGELSTDFLKIELGHLVAGSASGRDSADEITFFKSVGNAIQDMIVAGRAIDEARRRDVGFDVDLGVES
ncbi:MAG: ornithine cyclodeaminase family protein [Chloroflexota bacterium]